MGWRPRCDRQAYRVIGMSASRAAAVESSAGRAAYCWWRPSVGRGWIRRYRRHFRRGASPVPCTTRARSRWMWSWRSRWAGTASRTWACCGPRECVRHSSLRPGRLPSRRRPRRRPRLGRAEGRAGEFWRQALGYVRRPPRHEGDDGIVVEPPPGVSGVAISMDVSESPVEEFPRIHLDLDSTQVTVISARKSTVLSPGAGSASTGSAIRRLHPRRAVARRARRPAEQSVLR